MYINRSSILVPKLAHNVAFFCGNQGLDLLSLPGFPARANTTVDSAQSEVTTADPAVVAVWRFHAPFYRQVSLQKWSESCGVKDRASEQFPHSPIAERFGRLLSSRVPVPCGAVCTCVSSQYQ